MMTLEIRPPRHDRRDEERDQTSAKNVVLVSSGCGAPAGPRPPVAGPGGLKVTRVEAQLVSRSAAWHRSLATGARVSPMFAEPIGPAPGGAPTTLEHLSGVRKLLERSHQPAEHRDAIAVAIAVLLDADAVIAGPFSADDANAPGMVMHLAGLSDRAYRALRPPRELLIHPAFAQLARRFSYIQMTHREARALGAGAIDILILGRRLRGLQGDPGEFAITSFSSRGLLWADDAWWEIEPIPNGDETAAGVVFCIAWVVARRFRRAGAEQALAYARAATMAALRSATNPYIAP